MFDFNQAFCQQCGKRTVRYLSEKLERCTHCGFEFFHNVAAAVGVIVSHNDHILLLQRNKAPGYGEWGVPGGFVDPDENAEQALQRELQEETGIVLTTKLEFVGSWPNQYLYQNVLYRTLDMYFHLAVETRPSLCLQHEEVQQAEWVFVPNLFDRKLAFASTRYALEAFLHY